MGLRASIAKRIVGYQYYFNPGYVLSDQLNQQSKDTVIAWIVISKRTIPCEVNPRTKLKTLELVNTKIRKLPRKLRRLHQLNTIMVYGNKINEPLKLAKNSTIKSFIVCSDGIPIQFDSFRSLQTLDLSKNNLEVFPNIRGCQNLKALSLRENNIALDDLPSDFYRNLESLELQYNKINWFLVQ